MDADAADEKSTQKQLDLNVPYEGMEFSSEEAANSFYAAYAARSGFRSRISRYTRSRRDNSLISRRFVCSKQGFRDHRPAPHRHQRAATRVGCNAMLMVKKLTPDNWAVTKFVKDHNHGPAELQVIQEPLTDRYDDCNVAREPFEGMEFDSEEAARTHYSAYASRAGFRARISKYCRSRRDNSIISRQIVCSKEGFREIRGAKKDDEEEEGASKRPRVITRIGCRAMIFVKKLGSGKWVVSKFEREHNHPLLPSKSDELPVAGLQGTSADAERCPQGGSSLETLTVLYNQLCCEAIRYAQEGATTLETYNVAMSALREAVEKVAAAKRGDLSVAQPALTVNGTNQGFDVPQGGNGSILPEKALQELQCSSEVTKALAGHKLVLLQQPVSFVLIPSTTMNDVGSVKGSVEVQAILNPANGQMVHTPSDSTNTACSNHGIDNSDAIKPSPATQSVEGLPVNGSLGSDPATGRKRELQMTYSNACDAIQKYQKLEIVRVGRNKTTPRRGSKLCSPGFSETKIVTIPALPVALYMPMTGSLPESCSVTTPETPGGASPTEAREVSGHHDEAGALSPTGFKQPAWASQRTASTSNHPSDQVKSYCGPNPLVHATAIAAGARIIPPKAAATMIKAIEARIRSAKALPQPAFEDGCKLFTAKSGTPQPCNSDEGCRASVSQLHEDYQVQGASSEDTRFQKPVEIREVSESHSVVLEAGETQMELVESSGGC